MTTAPSGVLPMERPFASVAGVVVGIAMVIIFTGGDVVAVVVGAE
jgi:hypothetical protein